MNTRVQAALQEIKALVHQSRLLAASEQEALAERLETMVSTLRWEMLFHLPATDAASTLDPVAVSQVQESARTDVM